jgi:hypothetical protein
MSEIIVTSEIVEASVIRGTKDVEFISATGKYVAHCYDANGNLKWIDEYDNLVTTVGKNDLLDKYLSGSSYSATWYLGLISSASYTTGPVVGDSSSSHGGWTESTNYSQATRVTPTFSSAASGSKATSSASVFSINAADTIKGTFLISNSTKGGSTGVLYSAGTFTGGDKNVASGDVLNVTYTASVS